MTIPQLKNTVGILFAIVVVSLCGGIVNASLHGELRSFKDFPAAILDSLLPAVLMAIGWLGFKSPLAKTVQQVLKQETATETIKPTGETIKEKSTTTLTSEVTPAPADPPKPVKEP